MGAQTPFEGYTGKAQSQQQSGNVQSFTNFNPEDLAQLRAAQQGVLGQTGTTAGLANRLAQQAGQAPQIQAFMPGQGQLDQFGRALVSQGTQALNAQANTQARALQQQLGGQAGAGNVLARMAGMQARLQANPLLFQAAEGSINRGQQGFQNQIAAQQAAAQNRAGQLGLSGGALQAQQQLLPLMSAIAQQTGTQVQQSGQSGSSRSGGLLQNFGAK